MWAVFGYDNACRWIVLASRSDEKPREHQLRCRLQERMRNMAGEGSAVAFSLYVIRGIYLTQCGDCRLGRVNYPAIHHTWI
ncbi:unnamed protein product [Soboliphyme baturini]|uniref:Uncharacterized protein n=1 Tax=Soboliphyme baturini TaxID=241478 RepID=A0A183IFT7_9BILA|nr:unnamed protein product [Soboliphyme baturini]